MGMPQRVSEGKMAIHLQHQPSTFSPTMYSVGLKTHQPPLIAECWLLMAAFWG
jgi:hypothetical protein